MSFFNDFLNKFNLGLVDDKIKVQLIFGYGVMIFGDFKIENLSEELVILKSKKEMISIVGANMKIKEISKGEVFLIGDIKSIVSGV